MDCVHVHKGVVAICERFCSLWTL